MDRDTSVTLPDDAAVTVMELRFVALSSRWTAVKGVYTASNSSSPGAPGFIQLVLTTTPTTSKAWFQIVTSRPTGSSFWPKS